LIEDNAGDARLIQEMLTTERLAISSIERVDRLSKGVDRLAVRDIDAVLLDLGLPDSQGLNTFEKIQAVAQKVPILILTVYKDDSVALEAVRRGAQDYLIKDNVDGGLLIRAIIYAIERKKLDEAVKKQAELIDLSPDAIIIKKPDDTVTFWNLGAEKLYGWTKAQAIGQKTRALFKTQSSILLGELEEQLKQKGKWAGELIHETKLGRTVYVQSYWLAKFDNLGKIEEILESNVDITERKDAERLAAIGATAGMVGHDVRNPLQTIIGELYLAKKDLTSLPEGETKQNLTETLATIEDQVEYINKIVTDLQDFAKPLSPRKEEINLKTLLQNVLLTIDIPENVKVTQSIEEMPKFKTDTAYIKRILTNLFSNAVQAMPKGGKLTFTAFCKDEKIFLYVEDTGIGIPEEVRNKLFKPLFTTKARGQGFGLAVVKRLTEALNGKITFESEVGKGTRSIIEFPLQKTS